MPVDVSAPLPDLSYTDRYTLTVTLDDPAAVAVSLAVHYVQTVPPPPIVEQPVTPLLAYVPQDVQSV